MYLHLCGCRIAIARLQQKQIKLIKKYEAPVAHTKNPNKMIIKGIDAQLLMSLPPSRPSL